MSQVCITKHLKLPFQFDEKQLLSDLDKVLEKEWKDHFNQRVYSGDWKSIALYAPNGNPNDIFASRAEPAPIMPTMFLSDCEYFQKVFAHFKCELLSVRLLNLGPGSYIKPHRDHDLGYENGCFRLHIPIKTNPNVEFILGDVLLPMKPGECWYTNVNYEHSVVNRGNTDRVHLIIDGQRNEWSDALFFALASKESLLTLEPITYDENTMAQIIQELEYTKPEGYQQIINDMKSR
ncbi:MAG: aspartyl/asparaginyl beta-hydroxylase domain-containing protein [Bacteroidota bacterium]